MFLLSKPSVAFIRDFIARQAQSRFSYTAVGASFAPDTPAGYIVDHSRTVLGHGEQVWNCATRALKRWEMFNMNWLQLCWPNVPIVQGSNVAVLIHHFGFWSLNAARVVFVIDEVRGSIRRYGYSYGTLLDHSECGEERFSVEWDSEDDSVVYDLLAFSRPRAIAAKLGYPLTRSLQRRFREDSKSAMAKATGSNPIF